MFYLKKIVTKIRNDNGLVFHSIYNNAMIRTLMIRIHCPYLFNTFYYSQPLLAKFYLKNWNNNKNILVCRFMLIYTTKNNN